MRCFVSFLCLLVMTMSFSGCRNSQYSNLENDTITTGSEEYLSGNTTPIYTMSQKSIYENELVKYEKTSLDSINIIIGDNFYNIDGAKYYVQKDEYEPMISYSCWRVDLSKFSPIGISEDGHITVFAQNNSTKEVLVLEQDGELDLLAISDEILNPLNYTLNDFSYDCSHMGIDEELLSGLWDEHMKTNEDNHIAVLDGEVSTVRMVLSSNPALIYELYYIDCETNYYVSIPWVVK